MIIEILHRLQRIDHLIRIKGTGTPKQLANKIGVSERRIYVYLELMKQQGAPIRFCNSRQSYFYDCEGEFRVTFHSYNDDQLKSVNI